MNSGIKPNLLYSNRALENLCSRLFIALPVQVRSGPLKIFENARNRIQL